jgi:hypothetical protein
VFACVCLCFGVLCSIVLCLLVFWCVVTLTWVHCGDMNVTLVQGLSDVKSLSSADLVQWSLFSHDKCTIV